MSKTGATGKKLIQGTGVSIVVYGGGGSGGSASCVLEQAMHNIESGYINLRGDYGQQMKALLDEMRKITPAGNGNGNLPIGLQMSPQVAKRFEKLSFDLFVIRLRAMILSAYVR